MSETITNRFDNDHKFEDSLLGKQCAAIGASAGVLARLIRRQKDNETIKIPAMTIKYYGEGMGYAIVTANSATVRKTKAAKGKGKK
jgi:hypothetical protein